MREPGLAAQECAPIAALYVERGGVYYDLDGVDPWDEQRDARLYRGPHPVVAHPPCDRWGRYWHGGARTLATRATPRGARARRPTSAPPREPQRSTRRRRRGCAAHERSGHRPPRFGGWVVADELGGWTCCVEQGHYGHRARKATWLYARGVALPTLRWGRSRGKDRLDEGYHSAEERRLAVAAGAQPRARLTTDERIATPIAFRDTLIAIARSAHHDERRRVAEVTR